MAVARAARLSIRAAIDEAAYWRRLLADRAESAETSAHPIAGCYLVTTDRGVFSLSGRTVRRISRIPAFGVAIGEDRTVYCSTWGAHHTSIVAAPLDALLAGKRRRWREIWRLPIASFAARVHQISVSGDSLWLANTAENCLTRLDRHTGKWRATIAPFQCAFGHPIQNDHNHVNGVFAQPNFILFSAFKINRQSAFGVIGDGRLWLFSYPNMGVHDCAFDGPDFLFCDSYSFWDSHSHGTLRRNGRSVVETCFRDNAAEFVRGIAGTGDETIVGNSVTGSRDDRFNGRGQLFALYGDGRPPARLELPAAQIYDIVRADGTRFERPPEDRTATEVARRFTGIFGSPVLVTDLREALSGEHVKTFDDRDIGAVGEYLTTPSAVDHAANVTPSGADRKAATC